MLYVDTNILVYINDKDSTFYSSSSNIFYHFIEQNEIILHEIVLTEFFSIITDSRKMKSPWGNQKAIQYIDKLKEATQEFHFLNSDIFLMAMDNIKKYKIKRYNIYDHLLAFSMRYYGVKKILTVNNKDFEKYDFIKEIITPEKLIIK